MMYSLHLHPNSLDNTLTMEVFRSLIDGGYVGLRDMADTLAQLGIAPQLASPEHEVCSIGFSQLEGKWYGWSHRAICGYGVGSLVKKGDRAYIGATPEDLIEARVEFFSDISEEVAEQKRKECAVLPDRSGIRILTEPLTLPTASTLDELVNSLASDVPLPEVTHFMNDWYEVKCGRGEWQAQTIEDAKQMAIDFAEGVS